RSAARALPLELRAQASASQAAQLAGLVSGDVGQRGLGRIVGVRQAVYGERTQLELGLPLLQLGISTGLTRSAACGERTRGDLDALAGQGWHDAWSGRAELGSC